MSFPAVHPPGAPFISPACSGFIKELLCRQTRTRVVKKKKKKKKERKAEEGSRERNYLSLFARRDHQRRSRVPPSALNSRHLK